MEIKQSVLEMRALEPKVWFKRLIVLAVIIAMTIWSVSAIAYKGINPNGLQVVINISRYFVWPDSNPDSPVIMKYLFSLEQYAIPYLMF
jgi:hypothetical protein